MAKRTAGKKTGGKKPESGFVEGVLFLTTLVNINSFFSNEGPRSSETAEAAPSEELLQIAKDSLPDFDERDKCVRELDTMAQSVRNQNSSRRKLEIDNAKLEGTNDTLKKRPKFCQVRGVLLETATACSTGETQRIANAKDNAKHFLESEHHKQFCTELDKLPGIHADAQKGSKVVGKRADKAKSTIQYVAEKALGTWFWKAVLTIPKSSMSVQTMVFIEDVVMPSRVRTFSYIDGLLELMSQIIATSIDQVTKMIKDKKAVFDAKPQNIGPDSQQAWVTGECAWVLKLLFAASLTLDIPSSKDKPIKLGDVTERAWIISNETKRVPRSKLLEELAMNSDPEPLLFMKDKDLRLFAADNGYTSVKTATEILKVAKAYLADTNKVRTNPDYMKGLREKAEKKNRDKKRRKLAKGGAAEGGAAEGGAAEGGAKRKRTVVISDDESDSDEE